MIMIIIIDSGSLEVTYFQNKIVIETILSFSIKYCRLNHTKNEMVYTKQNLSDDA